MLKNKWTWIIVAVIIAALLAWYFTRKPKGKVITGNSNPVSTTGTVSVSTNDYLPQPTAEQPASR